DAVGPPCRAVGHLGASVYEKLVEVMQAHPIVAGIRFDAVDESRAALQSGQGEGPDMSTDIKDDVVLIEPIWKQVLVAGGDVVVDRPIDRVLTESAGRRSRGHGRGPSNPRSRGGPGPGDAGRAVRPPACSRRTPRTPQGGFHPLPRITRVGVENDEGIVELGAVGEEIPAGAAKS